MSAERVIPRGPKADKHLPVRSEQLIHFKKNLGWVVEVLKGVDGENDIGGDRRPDHEIANGIYAGRMGALPRQPVQFLPDLNPVNATRSVPCQFDDLPSFSAAEINGYFPLDMIKDFDTEQFDKSRLPLKVRLCNQVGAAGSDSLQNAVLEFGQQAAYGGSPSGPTTTVYTRPSLLGNYRTPQSPAHGLPLPNASTVCRLSRLQN